MSTQEVLVEVQPKRDYSNRSDPFSSRPRDYLFWSIVNTIFCSLIFGLVAVFFSVKVRENKKASDLIRAEKNSRYSFFINIFTTVFGIVTLIVFLVIFYIYLVHV